MRIGVRSLAVLPILMALGCAHHHVGPPLSDNERQAASGDDAIGRIHDGMTTNEVTAALGPPTGWDAHVTGLAFVPFSAFMGGTHETTCYFRGRGRVIFLNPGPFQLPRVIRVEPDPGERG